MNPINGYLPGKPMGGDPIRSTINNQSSDQWLINQLMNNQVMITFVEKPVTINARINNQLMNNISNGENNPWSWSMGRLTC